MAPIIEVSNEYMDFLNPNKYIRRNDLETSSINPILKSNSNISTISDWIYVPSINLEISRNKILHGEKFYDTQKALHSNNQRMPTIPEFREFLKYTKENHKDIYNEITEVRNPWRAEWLDADFKVEGKDLVVYYHIFENGKIVKKSEKLDKNTLMKDKTPGISLENWLEDSTKQGLPKNVVKSGDLYYWNPRSDNNSVAGFVADSDRAVLDCNGYPSGRGSVLGVRVAKLRE